MAIDFDALVLGPCMDSFGQPVTYVPGAGAPVAMVGIFDRAHTETDYEGDPPTIERRPVLGCRAAAFPERDPAENEQFIIAGLYWAVKRVLPDGRGHLKIYLHGPL